MCVCVVHLLLFVLLCGHTNMLIDMSVCVRVCVCIPQVMIVPISERAYGYAQELRGIIRKEGIYVDADCSDRKMQKKACAHTHAHAHSLHVVPHTYI